MEEADLINGETVQQKTDNTEIYLIEKVKIKEENEEYNIKFETKGNGLIIKVISSSLKDIINYQQYYSLYDLQMISPIFSSYKNIKDIFKLLKELKYELEKQNNEIIIKFNTLMPNKKRLFELGLKRYVLNDKEMVKYVLEEIILIKNNMKIKEEQYNEEKIKNEIEIKKLKEDISKAEAKISNLKNENEKLWEEINQMKLNNNKEPKPNLQNNLYNINNVNQIDLEQNNQNLYQQSNNAKPNRKNYQKNLINDNNINNNNINNTQIYGNINNDENQYLSKSNIIPNNYNIIGYEDEIDYQNNPYRGMRNSKSKDNIFSTFEILENNPETFTKIINNEDERVNFEFTIMNKSNKTFPGNGKSKLLFYKNNITFIKEINLSELKPGQKAKIKINFDKEKFYGKINLINMGLKIEGKLIDKPIVFNVINKLSTVEEFRSVFNLGKEDFDDERLFDVLKKNNYINEEAFCSLFNNI